MTIAQLSRASAFIDAVKICNLFMKKFSDLVDIDVKQALQDDRKIRQVIAQTMPPGSIEHVQFCRIENRVLKITLDNASWLARLRFISCQLIDELNRAGITAEEATWHVAPEKIKVAPRPAVLRERARSQAAADIVQATAKSMESDDLQQALMKVAKHLAKNTKS